MELWQPLVGDEPDAYDRAHAGEPMVRFLVVPEDADEDPVEALSFRVCIVHEAGFRQHVTNLDHMGVMSAAPDGVDRDAVSVLPPALDVAINPDHAAFVELLAGRYHYTQ